MEGLFVALYMLIRYLHVSLLFSPTFLKHAPSLPLRALNLNHILLFIAFACLKQLPFLLVFHSVLILKAQRLSSVV